MGVVGASGQVGYFLVPMLLGQGIELAALSRRERPPQVAAHPRLHWLVGALEQDWPQTADIDCLISAGPLDTLAAALDRNWPESLQQVVALSSTSVDSKQDSPDPEERQLASRLAASEDRLRETCMRHDATLVLIRPTLIYGCGRDRSLTPLLGRVRRMHMLPLPWPARGLRQPVHAEDLAALICACIGRHDLDGRRLDAGGGERLAFSDMLRRAARAVAGRHLVVPVPRSLLQRLFPHMRGAFARLPLDLVADNRDAQVMLGWQPRGFRPQACDLQNRTEPYVFRDPA